MEAIVFALISYLGWGVGDIFGTVAVRKIGHYSTVLWRIILGIILFSFYVPFVLGELKNLSFSLLILNIALGVIGIIGLLCFYEGLKRSNPSLIGTIYAAFAVWVVVFSLIFFREPITTSQIISIIVIFLVCFYAHLISKRLKGIKKLWM